MNTVTTIADEIFRELESPSDTSSGAISFWLRDNVGNLNSLLSTSYNLDSTGQFTPEFGNSEKDILKKLYVIYYYNKFIRANLGAASYDSVLEITTDGDTVKKVNKNEIAKTYIQLKNIETDLLNKLINGYKSNNTSPVAVHGDDIEEGPNYIVRDYQVRSNL